MYIYVGSDFKEVAPGGGGRLLSESMVEERIKKNRRSQGWISGLYSGGDWATGWVTVGRSITIRPFMLLSCTFKNEYFKFYYWKL